MRRKQQKKSFGKIARVRGGAEPSEASSLRHTPTSIGAAQPVPMRKAQRGANLTPYVTESLQHGEIEGAGRGGSSYYSPGRACKTKAGPPRRDQVELVFAPRNIPAGKHSKRPPGPGPALRFCAVGTGFGPVFPVKDPREAKKIAAVYQKCMRDPKAKAPACVEEATGQKVGAMAFGEARKRATPVGPRRSTAKKLFLFPWQRR